VRFPAHGQARLDVSDLALEDYFDFVNAVNDGRSVEARASFDIDWNGGDKHVTYGSLAQGFVGEFIEGTATIEWSAHSDDGFSYKSDDEDTSTTVFAAVGRERNGVLLHENEDDEDGRDEHDHARGHRDTD